MFQRDGELRPGESVVRLGHQRVTQRRLSGGRVPPGIAGVQRAGIVDQEQRLARQQFERALVRLDRVRRAAALEQDLALKLIEIRIVRLFGEQGVDLGQRSLDIGRAETRNGAGIAGRRALVGRRIIAAHLQRRVEEANELGAHHLVLALLTLRRRSVHQAGCLGELARGPDPVRRQRVRPEVRIAARIRQHFLIPEILEELDNPRRRLAECREVFYRGRVGGGFFGAGVDVEVEGGELAGAADQGGAGASLSGGDGEDAEADGDEGRAHGDRRGTHARNGVAAGDMAGFVADDAFDLRGIFGLDNQPGMQVDALAVRHERIKRRIIDDVEFDISRHEAGDFEDRVCPFAQRFLDFGVADHALCGCAEREHRRNGNSGGGTEQFCGHPESLH